MLDFSTSSSGVSPNQVPEVPRIQPWGELSNHLVTGAGLQDVTQCEVVGDIPRDIAEARVPREMLL